MNRNELIKNYWKYYCNLEAKFINTIQYVEIDDGNFSTFSNEYAMLLQAIGAELDNFFKEYCGFSLSDRNHIIT